MKICAACSQELPRDKFSKKQWQLKQRRRCKECIAGNREMKSEEEGPDDETKSPPRVDIEAASDEDLFKQPPPRDECPICMLPLPFDRAKVCYKACCGKIICLGCMHAAFTADDRRLCAFCRTPSPASDEDYIERLKKRAEGDDAVAMRNLGCCYRDGKHGLPQYYDRAMKLLLRAGELGSAVEYNNVGYAYENGEGVARDMKKAKYYYELAAMGGHVIARHNVGVLEAQAGNTNRAVKHWMISAGAGDDDSLTAIRNCFLDGHATKDDFEMALRAHKEANDEMKSDQREAAAAFYLNRD